MRRLFGMWGAFVLLVLGSQVALGQNPRLGPPPFGNCASRTFIIIAEGANDTASLSENLSSALDIRGNRALIRTIPWTRSESTAIDYCCRNNQLVGAAKMVYEVRQVRQNFPGSPIVLAGYCAGARVVLAAAEQLPPGAVDRIILLSPSVSSFYDVRPALRASRCGVDVFFNPNDNKLELMESELGTCDGARTTTAGLTAFVIGKNCRLGGDPLLANLRQYDISNFAGGHYAAIRTWVLQQTVVPLIPFGCGARPLPPIPQTPPPPPYGPPPVLPGPAPYGPPAPPAPPGPPPSAPYGPPAPPPGPVPPQGYTKSTTPTPPPPAGPVTTRPAPTPPAGPVATRGSNPPANPPAPPAPGPVTTQGANQVAPSPPPPPGPVTTEGTDKSLPPLPPPPPAPAP